MFIKNCILNAMGYSYVHGHRNKFHFWCLQKQKPHKNCPKGADFSLPAGLPNTIFWGRNAFYDPSCILNIVSYKNVYTVVYDKWTFEKESSCHFLDRPSILRISQKIVTVERFYCLMISTQVFLLHSGPSVPCKWFNFYLFEHRRDLQAEPGL